MWLKQTRAELTDRLARPAWHAPLRMELMEDRVVPAVTFAPASLIQSPEGAWTVAVADVNGDSNLDLVVAVTNSTDVSVLLGIGDGTFGAATNFTAGERVYSVAIADVNGDGQPDIITTDINGNPGRVSVLLGDGNGSFAPSPNSPFTVGGFPLSVAVADVNGDGRPDLVTANSHNVSVLLGDGNGSFGAATNFDVGNEGTYPSFVAVADVNGDGRPDLITANRLSHNVSVLLGDGNGSFGTATNFDVGTAVSQPSSVAVADVNGDGKPDLVTANYGSNDASVLLGDGNGSFGTATNFPAGTNSQYSHVVAVADIDGDGKPDLAIANYGSNDVSVLLGDGNGSFGAGTNFATGGNTSQFVVAADVNGDGKPDLVTANRGDGGAVSVLLNTTAPDTAPAVTAPADQAAAEDVSHAFDLGSFGDPDGGPWAVEVDWGDGTARTVIEAVTAGPLGAASHAYADGGTYHPTVTVTDGTGLSDSEAFTVTVTVTVPPDTAPAVTAPADQAAAEDVSHAFDLGSFGDPDGGPWAVEVDWGDGTARTVIEAVTAGPLGAASHAYADGGTYHPTVTVTDGTGLSDSEAFTVTVTVTVPPDTAPAVTAPADQAAAEDVSHAFDLGSFGDPDGGPWAVEVDWGDGTARTVIEAVTAGPLGAASHAYADGGTYSPTVTVTDGTGLSDSKTFTVTVTVPDTAPAVTAPADQAAAEDVSHAFDLGSFSDPDGGPWAVEVDWGDGTAHTVIEAVTAGPLGAASHAYADGGTYHPTVTVTDGTGLSDSEAFTVTVTVPPDTAPAVTAPADQAAAEDVSHAFDLGSFGDPDGGPWAVEVDWGDGTARTVIEAVTAGPLGAASHAYADGGTYHPTVTVTDGTGLSDSEAFTVTVTVTVPPDTAPAVTAPADQAAAEDVSHAFDLGSFGDPDGGPWAVDVDWGDGTAHTVIEVASAGPLGAASHAYADGGTYHPTVTVTDGTGLSDSEAFTVTVADAQLPVPATRVTTAIDGTDFSGEVDPFIDANPTANHEASDGAVVDTAVSEPPSPRVTGLFLGAGGLTEGTVAIRTAGDTGSAGGGDSGSAGGGTAADASGQDTGLSGSRPTRAIIAEYLLSGEGAPGPAAAAAREAAPPSLSLEGGMFAPVVVSLPNYTIRDKHPLPPVLPLDQTQSTTGFSDSGGDTFALIDTLYRNNTNSAPTVTDIGLAPAITEPAIAVLSNPAQVEGTPVPPVANDAPAAAEAAEDNSVAWRVAAATAAAVALVAGRACPGAGARASRPPGSQPLPPSPHPENDMNPNPTPHTQDAEATSVSSSTNPVVPGPFEATAISGFVPTPATRSADVAEVTAMRSTPSAPTVGDLTVESGFGRYELLGEIARGGMGVVYRARQHGLDRLVALKMMLGASAGEESAQRFLQEARAVAALDHPNVVPIYDIGEHAGAPYFTMALIEGPNLKAYVDARGTLPVATAVVLFAHVVAGVAHAHKNGIIHRDLKPANVLMDLDGRPRVTDFGLAKRAAADTHLTTTGQVVGTPAYMAPEQARDSKDVGPPADVYSLGAVLYFLLTGRPPFTGDSLAELLVKVMVEQPPSPRELRPDVPPDVEALCLRCLSKKPTDRPADALALRDELTPLTDQYASPSANLSPSLAQLGLPKSPSSGSLSFPSLASGAIQEVSAAVVADRLPPSTPSGSAGPKRANRRPLVLGLATVVAVLLAALGYLVTRGRTVPEVAKENPPALPGGDTFEWPPPARTDFGLKVELVAPAAKTDADGTVRLTTGTAMSLHLRAERNCRVSVWLLEPNGQSTRLFPNDDDDDDRLTAGTERVVPGNEKYTLETTPTEGAGVDRVRVIATTGDLPAFPPGAKNGRFTVFSAPERERVSMAVRGIQVKKTGAPAATGAPEGVAEAELRFRVK